MNYRRIIKKLSIPFIGKVHEIAGKKSKTRDEFELKKLLRVPRYTPGIATFSTFSIAYSDSLSLYHQYKEIVENNIYMFSPNKDAKHRIIDCGANIGLGSMQLRSLYPNAEIVAFEPNPTLFSLLIKNTTGMNIVCKQTALWSHEETIPLHADTADASSLTHTSPHSKIISVKTELLSNYLMQPVDFLKIDIEGAETEVVKEISTKLSHVKNIFIEYHCDDLHNHHLVSILQILTNAGFSYYLKPEAVPHTPFMHVKKTDNSFYFQVNIFASRKP